MEQKSKTYIRPIVIVMIFVFITIGYAYLTSALNINGATLLKKPTWDVHFENVQVQDGSVTGEQVTQEPEIDSEQTTVSFHINLKKPGDYYEFTVDAVNAGTIDAMINTITDFDLTTDQLKYLETSVTYEDGEEIQEKQQLLAGDFAVYKIIVSFKKDISEDDLPNVPDQLDLTYSVEYVQKDDTSIERRAETNSLYNVLKREAESGGLALKYTGEHQDSIDVSKSTRNIYHWYAENDYDGTSITNMFNVRFANHCWQMIRTTDMGGVRLLYNGEVVDNKCLDDRENHIGYNGISSIGISEDYWYGSDYSYEKNVGFKLSGNVFQANWYSSHNELIDMYTCKKTNSNDTCSDLYLIRKYNSYNSAIAIKITDSSLYSQYGNLQYSNLKGSPTYAGYMTGDRYDVASKDVRDYQHYDNTFNLLMSDSLKTTFFYADSYIYDNSTNSYSLVNPYTIDSNSEYSSLVGKYTFFSSSLPSGGASSLNYIVAINDTTAYYLALRYGSNYEDTYYINVSDTITEQSDNSFLLNNPISISVYDWYINYNLYKNKYTCVYGGTSCSNPFYITYSQNKSFVYIDASKKILLAKNRNDLQLLNTIVLRIDDFLKNSENYSDYKYTCNSISDICSRANLRYIVEYYVGRDCGYAYIPNRYFGSSYTWDGSKYVLENVLEIEDYQNFDEIAHHHYFCLSYGTTECSKLAYLYFYQPRFSLDYILLENGNSLDSMLDLMLKKNSDNSVIKYGVDLWFNRYLNNYKDYLEDSIYCNDRSIKIRNGWDPNGVTDGYLTFNDEYYANKSLACPNDTDKFCTGNNVAKLIYPVGLISSPEMELLNNNNIRTSPSSYYTFSPSIMGANYLAAICHIKPNGEICDNYGLSINYSIGVRPAITIKSGVQFEYGDGSKENPYYVKTEYDD